MKAKRLDRNSMNMKTEAHETAIMTRNKLSNSRRTVIALYNKHLDTMGNKDRTSKNMDRDYNRKRL